MTALSIFSLAAAPLANSNLFKRAGLVDKSTTASDAVGAANRRKSTFHIQHRPIATVRYSLAPARFLADKIMGENGEPLPPIYRPPTTKNCFFVRNNAQLERNKCVVRLPINRKKYRTLDALLDDLSLRMPEMPFGVRRIRSQNDRELVTHIGELENNQSYVCSGKTNENVLMNPIKVQEMYGFQYTNRRAQEIPTERRSKRRRRMPGKLQSYPGETTSRKQKPVLQKIEDGPFEEAHQRQPKQAKKRKKKTLKKKKKVVASEKKSTAKVVEDMPVDNIGDDAATSGDFNSIIAHMKQLAKVQEQEPRTDSRPSRRINPDKAENDDESGTGYGRSSSRSRRFPFADVFEADQLTTFETAERRTSVVSQIRELEHDHNRFNYDREETKDDDIFENSFGNTPIPNPESEPLERIRANEQINSQPVRIDSGISAVSCGSDAVKKPLDDEAGLRPLDVMRLKHMQIGRIVARAVDTDEYVLPEGSQEEEEGLHSRPTSDRSQHSAMSNRSANHNKAVQKNISEDLELPELQPKSVVDSPKLQRRTSALTDSGVSVRSPV